MVKKTTTKRRKPRRNPMRTKLIREMAKGKSLTVAAKEAGYGSPQAASMSLRRARETMPDLMDRVGFTDEVLIQKYLSPLLDAKKTLYFQNGGIVMDKREVPALDIRQSSLDMAFRLKNKYPNKLEIEHSGVVQHLMTETEKKEAAESLQRIAAFEGEESESVIDGEVVEA
jgi:hypothetical protein